MPLEIIHGFAYLKKAAAFTNAELGVLTDKKRDLIAQVCDEILEGKHDNQFHWLFGKQVQEHNRI